VVVVQHFEDVAVEDGNDLAGEVGEGGIGEKQEEKNMSAEVVSPCPAWEYEETGTLYGFLGRPGLFLRVTVERLPPYCGGLV
jgi:hypothetical protein